jgi:hypothetical protein
MSKDHGKTQHQRAKVLKLARDLARSGQHESHHTIVAQLHLLHEFGAAHHCLTERIVCFQLDRLCAAAQSSAQASGSALADFLAQTRQAARE